MPWTYDPTTPVGQVRLLITDTNVARPIFADDAEIEAFLGMNDDDIRLAAAQALDVIATNEALVLKVIQNMDLRTDGAAVAASLREHAKTLREQVETEPAVDYAEFAVNHFAVRDILAREALRRGT